jgi:hypothetical protein
MLARASAAVLLLLCLACGSWWLARYITAQKRTQWKGPALDRLSRLSITNEEVRQELEALKAPSTNKTESGWADEHVLLMTNGECIVYEYYHGKNDYFPPHLFLGHCSDGRWLYSSYHFCNCMNMVRWEDPPGSIAEFAKRYSAREFDGKSDECLRTTR